MGPRAPSCSATPDQLWAVWDGKPARALRRHPPTSLAQRPTATHLPVHVILAPQAPTRD